MQKGDIVEIIYQAKDGKLSQRHIRVIEAGETYVKAYCFTRRMIRIFQREGILAKKE